MFKMALVLLCVVLPTLTLAAPKKSLDSFLVDMSDRGPESEKRLVHMNFLNRPESYKRLAADYGISAKEMSGEAFMPFYSANGGASFLGSRASFELPAGFGIDVRSSIIPTSDEKYLIIDVYEYNRLNMRSKNYAKLFNLETWNFEEGLVHIPDGFNLVDVIDRPGKRYLAIGKTEKRVEKQAVYHAETEAPYEGVAANVLSRIFAAGGGGRSGHRNFYVTSYHKKATHISSESGLAKLVWVNYFESLWNSLRPEGSVKFCKQVF